MIRNVLQKLINGENLTSDESFRVMDKIMAGEMEDANIAAYLTALCCKGETEDEILGSCLAIRQHSKKIPYTNTFLVDTCGTGGDGKGTFNISTVSAFVVAGAGVPVAKHGNRAVSGLCGSADLLEALDISINLSPEEAALSLKLTGMAFLFAPLMHPAMAHAVPVRKALQIRTVFNILGPLNNPAGVKRQVIGVFDHKLTEKLASVLSSLGSEHALLVCGSDGTDEITLSGETAVTELKNGKINTYFVSPEDFGFHRVSQEALTAGKTSENARICLSVLEGATGSCRDVVLLNAGAAIYVSGAAGDLKEGIEMAGRSVDSGAALSKLKALQKINGGEGVVGRCSEK